VRGPATRRKRAPKVEDLAPTLPVARVAVDVSLPHLDRPFDYAVPASLDAGAVVGARVRVRFAGRLVAGYVLARLETTEHGEVAKLHRLQKVVSPEPVLTPAVAALARAVADRSAGVLADVLRLAVPPRHARVESEPRSAAKAAVAGAADTASVSTSSSADDRAAWDGHPAAPGYLDALANGTSPRAVWTVPPGTDVGAALLAATRAARTSGRGVLVVAPDARDAASIAAALAPVAGESGLVVLTADLGPAERYRRWLAVLRGDARVVVGTRAAMFAPVVDLGLAVIWDDGDDLHAEPRAPYPHVREVLGLRAHLEGAALLVAGHARTAEAARLVATGWAHALDADRSHVRAHAPRIRTVGDESDLARDPAARSARLPSAAWEAVRDALASGPVLVQVPRRGYAPALACARCREQARCVHCAGPLEATDADHAACGWCARLATGWTCTTCGGHQFRARVVGARRTAEELGRAFPQVPVRTSGRDGVLDVVPATPALVVATPGAEPRVDGGAYAAALLLDGDRLVGRPDLRAGEEALRRWLNAAALVRSAGDRGVVVVVADPTLLPVQALVRWDPAGFAERELAERATLHLPPAARVAALTGAPRAVAELLDLATFPPGAEVLGPAPVDESRRAPAPTGAHDDEPVVRALVRVPVPEGGALAAALHAAAGVRSARKSVDHVQVMIDPPTLG
jgi:primosomal protein N' (replication factor Y) (superfamily II helicase)